jgi:hypothetical protein
MLLYENRLVQSFIEFISTTQASSKSTEPARYTGQDPGVERGECMEPIVLLRWRWSWRCHKILTHIDILA